MFQQLKFLFMQAFILIYIIIKLKALHFFFFSKLKVSYPLLLFKIEKIFER